MHSVEATNSNFIVFGLTRSGLEPTIYCTRGTNHYTTNAVLSILMRISSHSDTMCGESVLTDMYWTDFLFEKNPSLLLERVTSTLYSTNFLFEKNSILLYRVTSPSVFNRLPEDCGSINRLNTSFFCVCPKPRTWIFNAICHGIFRCQWYEI